MAPTDKQTEEESQSQLNLPNKGPPSRNVPLVIVSERGRHSDESRRIVRAQAARASAAQSRVTRARNREGKENTPRENLQSPTTAGPQSTGQTASTSPASATPQGEASQDTPMSDAPAASAEPGGNSNLASAAGDTAMQITEHPLVKWLIGLLDLTPSGLLSTVQDLTVAGPAVVGAVASTVTGGLGSVMGSVAGLAGLGDQSRPQLPQAVPRGFTTLAQRIQISETVVLLVSRTSCFDFGSPGVDERLHQLLFDLIINHAKALLTPLLVPGHAIQGHLRIACTCLTIFSGQRANGFGKDGKYQNGLEAAWSEAMLLDQNALSEPKSAEASLWAVFIISVTTGATATYFHQLLYSLFNDLQLRSWMEVRNVLLDFIYPVSFLDEPCKSYFDNLQQYQVGVT